MVKRQYERMAVEDSIKNDIVTTVPEEKWGVHRTHCCLNHGCKYGNQDCPVELGLIIQDYPCEDCELEEDNTNLMDEHMIAIVELLKNYNLTALSKYEKSLRLLLDEWKRSK